MNIAVISAAAGISLYGLTILCFGGKAGREEKVKNRLFELGKEIDRAYLIADDELNKPFSDRVIQPLLHRLIALFSSLLPFGKIEKSAGLEKKRKMLQQAGWTISPEEYTVIQFILMISC